MSSTIRTVPDGRDVLDVTLVLDTNAYADNDVLAIPQEVAVAFPVPGDVRILRSVLVLDEDDQGQAFDLLFFNATATLGTINSAVSISDADARKVIGAVSVATSDYVDLVNSQVAVKSGLYLPLKAADNQSSLWIGAVVRSGTPTYTASGIRLKLGLA